MKSIFLNTLVQALIISGISFANAETFESVITNNDTVYTSINLSSIDVEEEVEFLNDITSVKSGITVNGDVMRVTEEAEASIEVVTMYGDNGMTYTFYGCYHDDCTYGISHVVKGCYEVVVESSIGGFMDTVCKV